MPGETAHTTRIACPHCHRTFEAELLAGGPERHRGYKCPHCKLFVAEASAQAELPQERKPSAQNP